MKINNFRITQVAINVALSVKFDYVCFTQLYQSIGNSNDYREIKRLEKELNFLAFRIIKNKNLFSKVVTSSCNGLESKSLDNLSVDLIEIEKSILPLI